MEHSPRPDELDNLVRFELPADSEPDLKAIVFRHTMRMILCALRDKAPYIYAFFYKASEEDFHVELVEDIQSLDCFEKMSIESCCS